MVRLWYDSHVHTRFSDGKSTVDEIRIAAISRGLEYVVISDHVRKDIKYKYEDLLDEIESANKRGGVCLIPGAEAKVLSPDGELDISDNVFDMCDILIGSVHSLGSMTIKEAYIGLVNSRCDILGHPYNMPIELLIQLGDKMVELNERYPLSHEMLSRMSKLNARVTVGTDSHRASDVGVFCRVNQDIKDFNLNVVDACVY